MQKLKWLILYLFLFFMVCSFLPATTDHRVNWISLSQAEASLQQNRKPILIDLYTDWCGWCKVMDKKTYSNKKVAEYLQEKFYAVRVNAETKEEIRWNGKSYHFSSGYRVNDFAVFVTKGRLEFPTTIIIPSDGSEPQAIAGYLEPKDFEMIAKYFGEGRYGKIPFEDYQKSFHASW